MAASPRLPVIFCFAGQGSQYYQMAADLYADQAVFRQWLEIGDEVVRARHGFGVTQAIYDPGRRMSDSFDRLEETNPAVFLVQYALAKLLLHHGLRPDALFGVSLGEITGMAVAGMAPFETALAAVSDQPAVYARTCPPGGMIAVLGPPSLHAEMPELAAGSEIAGINAGSHFVLSAPRDRLSGIETALQESGWPCQRLAVPFAFHSRWIEPAAAESRSLYGFPLRSGQWPCWSSCLAAPMDARTSDAATPSHLAWQIIRGRMRVRESVEAMEAAGGAHYLDLSPSGTFSALLPQVIRPESYSTVTPILSPFGKNLQRLAAALRMRDGSA